MASGPVGRVVSRLHPCVLRSATTPLDVAVRSSCGLAAPGTGCPGCAHDLRGREPGGTARAMPRAMPRAAPGLSSSPANAYASTRSSTLRIFRSSISFCAGTSGSLVDKAESRRCGSGLAAQLVQPPTRHHQPPGQHFQHQPYASTMPQARTWHRDHSFLTSTSNVAEAAGPSSMLALRESPPLSPAWLSGTPAAAPLHTRRPSSASFSTAAATPGSGSSMTGTGPSSTAGTTTMGPASDNGLNPLERRRARRAEARESKGPMPQRGKLVDAARFRAAGGHGGAGVAAFEPVGRGRNLAALGGNGGPGGDVLVRASRDAPGLHGIMTSVTGGRGGPGGAGGQSGGRGLDRVVQVPLGTTVRLGADTRGLQQQQEQRQQEQGQEAGAGMWVEGGEVVWEDVPDDEDEGEEVQEEDGDLGDEGEELESSECPGSDDEGMTIGGGPHGGRQDSGAEQVVELTQHGQELLVARGGAGGRGNKSFPALAGRPAPDTSEPGQPGELRWVILETRLLADVGFVGLPNAGKSTLLGAITAARAKVGAYAFTTVRPQLGTITFEDGSRLVTADIPGLVQGAHANKGRGNAFLRHIERCRCLAYVIDLSGGTGSKQGGSRGGGRCKALPRRRDPGLEEQEASASLGAESLTPAEQLAVLQDELGRYSPRLLEAPALVVANKLDAVADPAAALAELAAATPLPIVPVSAAGRVGLRRLTEALRVVVQLGEQRKAPAVGPN